MLYVYICLFIYSCWNVHFNLDLQNVLELYLLHVPIPIISGMPVSSQVPAEPPVTLAVQLRNVQVWPGNDLVLGFVNEEPALPARFGAQQACMPYPKATAWLCECLRFAAIECGLAYVHERWMNAGCRYRRKWLGLSELQDQTFAH